MSLFSTLATGQGYAQGASSIQLHGMDAVMRKGGTGKVLDHAPMSKSATIRTIQDGFKINNVSNLDLILRRKAPPSAESMRHNSAGTLASERRGPDFPAVVRQTSIEHAGSRRHSPPPARQQRGQENLMVKLATVKEDANLIGRDTKARQRSQSRARSSSPIGSPRARSAKRVRSLSPRKTTILPVFMPESATPTELYSCTWGESHAFDGIPETYVEVDQEAIIMCNQESVVDKEGTIKGSPRSDDGRSTTTGGSSPVRMFSSSSFFSDCPTPRSVSSAVTHDSFVDIKRCSEMYESRMRALVKAEQKKAMRKWGM